MARVNVNIENIFLPHSWKNVYSTCTIMICMISEFYVDVDRVMG